MIKEIISKLLQSGLYEDLNSFVSFFYHNGWFVLGIYIISIGITLIRIRYTTKTLFPIQQKANKKLDLIWYEASKYLYNQKESLHNLSENIPLLLHYKTECLFNNNNPRNNIEKIYEEYIYICQLTNQNPIISKEDILYHKNIILKLQQTKNSLTNVLSYMTLGLSHLLL